MARKIIGSYFRLLFLRFIHDELMRKMTEVENLPGAGSTKRGRTSDPDSICLPANKRVP